MAWYQSLPNLNHEAGEDVTWRDGSLEAAELFLTLPEAARFVPMGNEPILEERVLGAENDLVHFASPQQLCAAVRISMYILLQDRSNLALHVTPSLKPHRLIQADDASLQPGCLAAKT